MTRDFLEAVIRAEFTRVHREGSTTLAMNQAVARLLTAADRYAGWRQDSPAATAQRRQQLDDALRTPRKRVVA